MRKSIFKLFAILFALCTLGLASCAMDRANVYNYWKNGSSEYLPKDHIVEGISINSLVKKVNNQKEDDDIIYVFFGQTNSDASRSAIKVYNEQAVQYNIKTLYWVDSNGVSSSDSKKNKLTEKLGVSQTSIIPAIWVFDNGKIAFDSSRPSIQNQSKMTSSTILMAEVAFKCLYNENGEYTA